MARTETKPSHISLAGILHDARETSARGLRYIPRISLVAIVGLAGYFAITKPNNPNVQLNVPIGASDTFSSSDKHGTSLLSYIDLRNPASTEQLSAEQTMGMLQALQQKIDTSTSQKASWTNAGIVYHVQPGDTLDNLAARYGIRQDQIKDMSNITGQKATVTGKLWEGQVFLLPTNKKPDSPFDEIYSKAGSDLAQLKSNPSSDVTSRIESYWNTAPKRVERAPAPQVIVDPEAIDGNTTAQIVTGLTSKLPKLGQGVDRIIIQPQRNPNSDKNDPGAYMSQSEGKTTLYFSMDPNKPLSKERTLSLLVNMIACSGSIYNPNSSQFFTPKELIALESQDTQISNETYKLYPGTVRIASHETALIQEIVKMATGKKDSPANSQEAEISRQTDNLINDWAKIYLGVDNLANIAR
ncbi:MAG: LysM peptidoglycan-binding domain-containing protein [Candidatus Daviesbacteria bacterium]|nr:LysM peptidoglycan-binding domain-containing protein [Candidatus Daviesbacteria bacterium]